MKSSFSPASHSRCVVLVRHGETEWSRDGLHTGTTDVDLTEAGEQQARDAGEVLRAHPFGLALTSPLGRARRTAELAGFPDAVVDADLAEWDYGPLEGRSTPDIVGKLGHPWNIWDAVAPDPLPAESADAVGARADRAIARAQSVLDGGADAVIFAHAHLLRIFAARWLGLPARDGAHFALSTGSLSELGFEHGTRVIDRWNMQP